MPKILPALHRNGSVPINNAFIFKEYKEQQGSGKKLKRSRQRLSEDHSSQHIASYTQGEELSPVNLFKKIN